MRYLSGIDFFEENEKIALTCSHYEPTIEKHKHNFYEIAYITKGEGYHIINDCEYEISEGSLFLIAKDSIHTYRTESNLEWINILFDPQIIDLSLINSENAHNVLYSVLFPNVLKYYTKEIKDAYYNFYGSNIDFIIQEMYREYCDKYNGYQEVLSGYLQVILTRLFRTQANEKVKEDSYNQNKAFIQVVLDFMGENSIQELCLDMVAKETFMSPRNFQRIFKKITGESFTTFVRKYKINKACDLLISTNMTISEIMNYVDMPDSKNFYNTFKRYKGLTPKNYREENLITKEASS